MAAAADLRCLKLKKGEKVNSQVRRRWKTKGERQAKLNTFDSRLKLLIPAYLYTINKDWEGGQKTAGTKPSPLVLRSVHPPLCALRGLHSPTTNTNTPNASFSFRRCHLHWFSICFSLAVDHQLYSQERVYRGGRRVGGGVLFLEVYRRGWGGQTLKPFSVQMVFW